MKVFLQEINNLALILQEKYYLAVSSARLVHKFLWKASFLAQELQDIYASCKSCKKNACKTWTYSLQDGFYSWDVTGNSPRELVKQLVYVLKLQLNYKSNQPNQI